MLRLQPDCLAAARVLPRVHIGRVRLGGAPPEGRIHGFSIQETGIPAGFSRPLVFAVVEVAGLRVFAALTGVSDPATLRVGAPVRLAPVRVADDPQGQPRYLLAFTPAAAAT